MRPFWIAIPIAVLIGAGVMAQGQPASPAAPANSDTVIRVETRMVLVDVVAADKKGNYVRDLTASDFRVWEDDKEQEIKSFSLEGSGASGANSLRYLVLFFDNSTMTLADQVNARRAAGQFIQANAGPNRLMAVVNFTGTVRIAQNFTSDVERLTRAVSGAQTSSVSPNIEPVSGPAGMPSFGLDATAADFGVRSDLIALRQLAKNLAGVPGRKTLVWLTSGFPLSPEQMSEVKATISECNKANVAVYPIDARGLVAMAPGALLIPPAGVSPLEGGGRPFLQVAAFGLEPVVAFAQRAGGGGGTGTGSGGGGSSTGGGGGRGGGSPGGGSPGGGRSGGTTGGGSTGGGSKGGSGTTGGSTGGSRGGVTGPGYYNPNGLNNQGLFNRSSMLIPQIPNVTNNQQVMYMLAEGTGGFVIANSNDVLGALQKISRDLDQYYLIGYTPAQTDAGSCHSLRVKVGRSGVTLRSRSAYCNIPPQDLLAGSSVEKDLENRAVAEGPGEIKGSLADPFFYVSPNTARVNVAMDVPAADLKAEKLNGKLHAEVNILGVAYKADGKAAARFSDTIKLDFENKKELEKFTAKPMHYENEFDVAAGSYTFKLVFSMGGKFGKLEAPLVVDPWDGKQFSLSGVAFSTSVHRVDQSEGLDAAMLQGHTPLVAEGMQITPSSTNRLKKTDMGVLYVEVYEPLLADPNPPQVGLQLRVLDRKTGKVAEDRGLFSIAAAIRPGSPVIPVGLKLPTATLAPGSYRAELKAMDSTGHETLLRTADFDLEP
ncbi:MAG TPA: VWA domain-containing protein [Bryobacteraceae bacterium]|nr:VWA domain-containing protein [Bryobacteraceae bacterium]